ncbi:MAG TPA: hypothetical protein VLA92_01375 [Candidatus Saccharimonadales bacterium]|nr:hypothetical protein [Candidatus Saccharimonadales bacterium]
MEKPRHIQALEDELQLHRDSQNGHGALAIITAIAATAAPLHRAFEGGVAYNNAAEMAATAVGLAISALCVSKSIAEENSAEAVQRALAIQQASDTQTVPATL